MAAIEEGGRRTRSGRNAPVVSPQQTRRTRRTTAEEDPEAIQEAETKEEEVIEAEPTMTTDVVEEEEQPMTVEDDSNDTPEDDDDDQFLPIPDGNGVANNGIEEIAEETMDDNDSSSAPTVPVDEPETKTSSEGEGKSTVDGTDVTMASDDDPSSTANALKRKIESGEEDEVKKQKIEDTPVNVEPEVEPKEEVKQVEEEIEEVKIPPKLPDLEKYWKPVNEDWTNFTGWTYLLQYVDQETDVEAAREAYNSFLGHYPYCYGYWRKYADYEKKKTGDDSKCEEVFERGLSAIPLSVDLWIHFLNYVKATHPDDEEKIRSHYERALNVCGLEFRSDKLWDAYIKWEMEGKRLQRVVDIYDRLLATPTLGYNSHLGTFTDFVLAHPIEELLTAEEFEKLKLQLTEEDDEVSAVVEDIKKKKKTLSGEELEAAIRKQVIAARQKIHDATVQEVTNRWTFEEAVKRPYFHVKPLERCQLKNWTDYLDYEIECGVRRRIIVLFERCLIACALYEEYWQKYVRFLNENSEVVDQEALAFATRDVYERACTIHHKEKPRLHLMWSYFEECQGNIEKAAEILANIDDVVPNVLQIEYRRINVERRRENFDKCEELFKKYVVAAKSQHVESSLVIKHARFVHKIRKDLDRALEILRLGQKGDPTNVRIPLQMIDMAMQRQEIREEEVVEILDAVLEKEDLDTEQKVLFAQRKVEFLEDFGNSPKLLQQAQKVLQAARTTLQEQKKAKSLENNNGQMHPTGPTAVAPPQQMQQQQQQQQHLHQHHQQVHNQYANYSSYYGQADPSAAYGSYSDPNYYHQQYGQNNYYANNYQ